MENKEFIQSYFFEMREVIKNISIENIDRVIELLFDVWKRENQIFICGNGGSASTATHFTSDLAKSTIIGNNKRFKVISLGDNVPLVSAWTNDSSFGTIFVEQLRPWIKKDDVLIGISVHGGSGKGDAGAWSQNIVKAMSLAKERRAKIVGFSGFDGGAIKEMADVCVVVPIDTEPFGTPLVESFHVVLHHLVCSALKQKIENS